MLRKAVAEANTVKKKACYIVPLQIKIVTLQNKHVLSICTHAKNK